MWETSLTTSALQIPTNSVWWAYCSVFEPCRRRRQSWPKCIGASELRSKTERRQSRNWEGTKSRISINSLIRANCLRLRSISTMNWTSSWSQSWRASSTKTERGRGNSDKSSSVSEDSTWALWARRSNRRPLWKCWKWSEKSGGNSENTLICSSIKWRRAKELRKRKILSDDRKFIVLVFVVINIYRCFEQRDYLFSCMSICLYVSIIKWSFQRIQRYYSIDCFCRFFRGWD